MISKILFTFLTLAFTFSLSAQSTGYQLDFKIHGLKDTVVNLTYYFGSNNYYKDTATVDAEGNFTFEGDEALNEGLFSLIKGKEKLFDLLIVGEQHFSVETELKNLIGEMKIDGSTENELFYEYLVFLRQKQDIADKLLESKENLEEGTSEYKDVQEEIDDLNEEVKGFMDDFKKKNSKSFTVKFLESLEYPKLPEKAQEDSTYQLQYLRQHIFDGIDFTDVRMIRIPSYHEKMMYFLEKLTYPVPDSIIKSLKFLMKKAEKNPEIFKYTLSTLTVHYERSKKMGMDAIFVYLAKEYYLKGKTPWMDEKQIDKIEERVLAMEPLLIGKKAPNIIVKDTAQEKIISLYDVEAKYTIVYIWSPECGHCKVATPKLLDIYHKYKDRGVKVFAVGNEFENQAWLEYIRKHDLDWINGSDGGTFRSNFRTLYDVYATPQTYLLDENKIILSKKMDMPSLERIIEHELQKDEKELKNDKK